MSAEKPSSKQSSLHDGGGHNGNKTSNSYLRIFSYADRFSQVLCLTSLVGAIVTGASLPLMTLIFGQFATTLSDYTSNSDSSSPDLESRAKDLVLYFVYLFIGRFIIGYVSTLCICVAAARTTNALRKTFLESLLRKDISHFDAGDNGSPAAQVTTNGHRINQGIAEKLYAFVSGMALFFSAYVVALTVYWKLALITMSIIPAVVVVMVFCIKLDAPVEARVVSLYSRAATVAQDALASIKTIRAFGAGARTVETYDGFLQEAHTEGKKKSVIFGVLFSHNYFLVFAGTALAFWQGFRFYRDGDISDAGTVFTVVLSVTLGATSVMSVLGPVSAITNATSAATELFSVIDKPSTIDPLAGKGLRPDTCRGDIELRDVHFAYPSRPSAKVLRGLNLVIPAGKTTAIVGPSGSGKSTVVGLIERWYEPSTGGILLDGQDVSELDVKWLRGNIRLVQQEPTLFAGTVFENVAKGLVSEQRSLPHDEKRRLVVEACQAADADAFIRQLPQGYDTQLGEAASTLSGGQRQRISIARSIISNPSVLLCDEATSALDPVAERAVQEALGRVSKGKTALVIAHKLATIAKADNIVVMAGGKVVEQGSHSDLLSNDGLYAAMVRAQDLGTDGYESDGEASPSTGANKDWTKEAYPMAPSASRELPVAGMGHTTSPDSLTAGTLGLSLIQCISIMLGENRSLYGWYALITVAYVVTSGTYPAQALLFSRFLEIFSLEGDEAQKRADLYSLLFFVVALANLVGYFIIGIATNVIGQALTHRYRKEMLERMTVLDQEFFDCPENSSGALTAKLSSVPSAVQELMSANLGLAVTVIVNVLSTSILGIATGWKLGLVMVFAGMGVILGAGFLRVRLDMKLEAATERQFSTSASLASEAVGAIRTVSSLTLEDVVLHEYGRTLDDIVSQVARSLTITLIPYSFAQSADFLVMALGFWYGCRLVAAGEYTVTQFFTIFVASVFGGQAAAVLLTYTSSFTKASSSANYMLWLRNIETHIEKDQDHNSSAVHDETTPELPAPELSFDQVGFHYRQRPSSRVLRDVSLRINSSTFAAFVGPSGCGKSTVISLLERFYDPTTGRIMFDGVDASASSPVLHRRHISLVQQEAPLYMGSVRDNVALGLEREVSDDEIREACEQANAWEFVASLPEGLQTPCGARGLQLSGGQRQRIAVARALIRKPRLLLLDEATSALDTQSERIVQEALERAASNRTTVAVAHRLSTVRHAHVIFVVMEGRVVEAGTHEELQRQRGQYHAMCVAQALDQL